MPPPSNLQTLAEIPEPATFQNWIDVYCRLKPDHNLHKAAIALHSELARRAGVKK